MRFETTTAAPAAFVLWGIAALCLLLGLLIPKTVLPLYLALTAISLPISYVLSHVLFAIVYYGIITPLGLIFRLMGRDPLERRFDPQASSYWMERSPQTSVRRYFRQF